MISDLTYLKTAPSPWCIELGGEERTGIINIMQTESETGSLKLLKVHHTIYVTIRKALVPGEGPNIIESECAILLLDSSTEFSCRVKANSQEYSLFPRTAHCTDACAEHLRHLLRCDDPAPWHGGRAHIVSSSLPRSLWPARISRNRRRQPPRRRHKAFDVLRGWSTCAPCNDVRPVGFSMRWRVARGAGGHVCYRRFAAQRAHTHARARIRTRAHTHHPRTLSNYTTSSTSLRAPVAARPNSPRAAH